MKTITRIAVSLTTVLTLGVVMSSNALAQASAPAAGATPTKWEKNHPRRTEVNERIEHQNKRIAKEVKEGELTKPEAKELRANDKAIRVEEKAMAKQDGGHITKTEQKALNQQLNKNSKKIGK